MKLDGCFSAQITVVTLPAANARLRNVLVYALRNAATVSLPQGLQSVDVGPFARSLVQHVEVPSSVRYIQKHAFADCERLRSVGFAPESGLKKMEACCFRGSGVEELAIPSRVSEVGDFAFQYCKSIRKVGFQEDSQLRRIGRGCFAESELSEITVPRSVARVE